jgi:hypothetical protein
MYNNEYNNHIIKKLNQINKDLLNHENKLTHTDPTDHKITSRLEGSVIRNKNIRGGSGYAAATLGDHGYPEDEMVGAKGSGKLAAGFSAAGMSAAGKKKEGVRCDGYDR